MGVRRSQKLHVLVLVSIHLWRAEDWDPGLDEGRVPPDQGDRQALVQMADSLLLLPARGGDQHPPQLGNHLLGLLMPGPKGLDREGEEGETLVLAGLVELPHFLSVSGGEGGPSLPGCTVQDGAPTLERGDDSEVHYRVPARTPAWYDDVPGALLLAALLLGQEVSLFLPGVEAGLLGCLIDDVPQRVVAGYPLPMLGTPQRMVPKDITGEVAGYAGASHRENWEAQPVPNPKEELGGGEVEAKSPAGYCVEPVASVAEGEAVRVWPSRARLQLRRGGSRKSGHQQRATTPSGKRPAPPPDTGDPEPNCCRGRVL